MNMEMKFKVSGIIAKPVEEVFEAVADPEKLSGYFTTGGAEGRLETGATVMWDFHDFPGKFPVDVVEVVPNEKIVLQWEANEGGPPEGEEAVVTGAGYNTTVTFEFEQLEDGRTLVTIAEEGWHSTPNGLKATLGNCHGWTFVICAMKVWLEHGINLREGFYK